MKHSFLILSVVLALVAPSLRADGCYTNLAGTVICGRPLAISPHTVAFSNALERTVYRLAIFPDHERRRIAAELGSIQFVSPKVMLALKGAEKAMKRVRQRVVSGQTTIDHAEDFCAREREHVRRYLDHQVAEGHLTAAERDLLQSRFYHE